MALMNWDPKLMTGIEEVDNQHRKLVELINTLHDAMKAKKAKEVLDGVLKELADYTKYHFATEERAFDAYGYSQKEAHKRQHAQFIEKVADLYDRFSRNQLGLSIDVLDFLVAWVTGHIKGEDMKYVPELKGKPFS